MDFYHPMGLEKLKNLRIAKQNQETVFEESRTYYCWSFFQKEQKEQTDYTKDQAIYTRLYKKEVCLSTGEKQI